MSASKQTAFDYIDEKSGVITDVSDKIWDYAELSLREYKSGELYAKVLKEEGFTVEHPFDNIETAFRASYGSGKPVIGILSEYDALTGLSQIAGSETRKELVADGNVLKWAGFSYTSHSQSHPLFLYSQISFAPKT